MGISPFSKSREIYGICGNPPPPISQYTHIRTGLHSLAKSFFSKINAITWGQAL